MTIASTVPGPRAAASTDGRPERHIGRRDRVAGLDRVERLRAAQRAPCHPGRRAERDRAHTARRRRRPAPSPTMARASRSSPDRRSGTRPSPRCAEPLAPDRPRLRMPLTRDRNLGRRRARGSTPDTQRRIAASERLTWRADRTHHAGMLAAAAGGPPLPSCDCGRWRQRLRSRLRHTPPQSRPRPSDGHSLEAEPGSKPHQRCGVGADDRADRCGIAWRCRQRHTSSRGVEASHGRGRSPRARCGRAARQDRPADLRRAGRPGNRDARPDRRGRGHRRGAGDVHHRPGEQHERKPHDDRHRARQDLGRDRAPPARSLRRSPATRSASSSSSPATAASARSPAARATR